MWRCPWPERERSDREGQGPRPLSFLHAMSSAAICRPSHGHALPFFRPRDTSYRGHLVPPLWPGDALFVAACPRHRGPMMPTRWPCAPQPTTIRGHWPWPARVHSPPFRIFIDWASLKLSPEKTSMREWWTSLSTRAAVRHSSPKTAFQLANSRLLVTIMLLYS